MNIVQTNRLRRALTPVLLLLISSSLTIAGAEVIVRLLGHQPWQPVIHINEPTTHEFHSTLGWVNKAGDYHFAPYSPGEDEIRMTFLDTGLRRTHDEQSDIRDDRAKMIFVGGSFTQGLAISDHETYPWKLQKHFPSFEVLNYGTGGYGTYQSLLTLEHILPTISHPRIIVYGFIGHHVIRNIAPSHWLASLAKHSRRSHVFLPYATVENGNLLTRHKPAAYSAFPFRETFAIIALVERAFMKLKTYGRMDQKTLVTEKLVLEMQHLAAEHGSQFVIVLLYAGEKTRMHFRKFSEDNGMLTVDCAHPLTEEMVVKGEGHPNGAMNSKWASCIEDFIDKHTLTIQ